MVVLWRERCLGRSWWRPAVLSVGIGSFTCVEYKTKPGKSHSKLFPTQIDTACNGRNAYLNATNDPDRHSFSTLLAASRKAIAS
jgi:hypothetical protein